MWSDNETSEDLLGFKVHADLIIDVVNDESVLPVTIGVFGDWGSGKSSILKIIKEELDGLDDKTLVLYFNSWLFEGYDDAKAALLESIIKEFDENKKFGDDVKEKTKKLFKSIDWMRVLGLGFKNIVLPATSALLTGGVSLAPFLAQKLSSIDPHDLSEKLSGDGAQDFLQSILREKGDDKSSMLVREFRDGFTDLIDTSKIKKLIVIIDDLDRCLPDRIIENLEAIKLFLNVDKTAFIIGADPRIVRHAIDFRFKSRISFSDINNRIVDDYLEKLIQIPYYLPKLSDSEVETYISLLVCKRELSVASFEKVLEEFKSFREENRYSVFGLSNIKSILTSEESANLTNSLIAIPFLAPIITQSLYGNPRQIKRFLNTFILRKRLADIAKIKNFKDAVLAKLMILEYAELPLFQQIYDWQVSQDGIPEQLKKLEEICDKNSLKEAKAEIQNQGYKNWIKEKVIKWLCIDPKLKDIDLRDYYWISRDSISSSIPGASLIPPIIKTIFSELDQEELPALVSKKIITDKVNQLNESELYSFLDFSSQMLKRNPKRKRLYDIFHFMIDENILSSLIYYRDTLQHINLNDIPPAVGTALKKYRNNSEIGEFLIEYFKNGKSASAKAFNLK